MSVTITTQDVLKNRSLVTTSSSSIPVLCCVSAAPVLLSALCIRQGHSSSNLLCTKRLVTVNIADIPGNRYLCFDCHNTQEAEIAVLYILPFAIFYAHCVFCSIYLIFFFTTYFEFSVVKSPCRPSADSVSQHNSFAASLAKLFENLVK